jgi:hypothetical protein
MRLRFQWCFLAEKERGHPLQRNEPRKFWFRAELLEATEDAQSRHFPGVGAHFQQLSGKPNGQSEGELMARKYQ